MFCLKVRLSVHIFDIFVMLDDLRWQDEGNSFD
jgi:hypothetical protein